jgi:hypothetical protein
VATNRPDLQLDQNFPAPILQCLDDFLLDVRLVPLSKIDSRLSDLDDRNLIIALHQLGFGWLITNNYRMLRNPRELAAIMKTKLTIFAIEGLGHDPIRATGVVLLDLPTALKRVNRGQAQVFWLRPREPAPKDAWDLFTSAAGRRNQPVNALYQEVAVSNAELTRPVLDS